MILLDAKGFEPLDERRAISLVVDEDGDSSWIRGDQLADGDSSNPGLATSTGAADGVTLSWVEEGVAAFDRTDRWRDLGRLDIPVVKEELGELGYYWPCRSGLGTLVIVDERRGFDALDILGGGSGDGHAVTCLFVVIGPTFR